MFVTLKVLCGQLYFTFKVLHWSVIVQQTRCKTQFNYVHLAGFWCSSYCANEHDVTNSVLALISSIVGVYDVFDYYVAICVSALKSAVSRVKEIL